MTAREEYEDFKQRIGKEYQPRDWNDGASSASELADLVIAQANEKIAELQEIVDGFPVKLVSQPVQIDESVDELLHTKEQLAQAESERERWEACAYAERAMRQDAEENLLRIKSRSMDGDLMPKESLYARIIELEDQIGKAQVCGSCDHYDSFGSAHYCRIECPERVHAYDHERSFTCRCQYEPSRWRVE